ncbi:MAG: LamG-like jellyroll fold domain-containing protein [Verrucomicrobiia bacterium]|jgi:hypothetical protein
MKTMTFLGQAVVIAVVSLTTLETRAADGAASPVAQWSFEEVRERKVADSVGNHTGTVKGALQQMPGVEGQGMKFDDCVVSVPPSPSFRFTNATFSIAAWVNPYALDGSQQMIVAKNAYSAGQREWGLMLDKDNRFRFYLSHKGWKTIASQSEPRPGHWHHVAVTVEKGHGRLYINGKQEAEGLLASSVAATDAPLTIGGVQDGRRAMQEFLGALDEMSLFRGVLTPAAIRVMADKQTTPHKIEVVEPVKIWSGGAVPKSAEIPVLKGVEFHVIKKHESGKDGYPWLHGVGLAWHKGKLYASFGHNKGAENTASEEARGRVSEDGGRTWSDVFTIDTGTDAPDLAVSHGVFLSHGGTLWAFHGAFYGRMGRIHTRAYVLDEAANKWLPKGVVVVGGFWALNQPVKMSDGNWIMAGIRAKQFSDANTNPAAVAISHGDDLTKWEFIAIPAPDGIKMWGESAIIVDGSRVLNIARYGGKALALVASSEDYGRTWTKSAPSNLPMATSKPCAGTLSNGQRYLVCTTTADSGGRRSPLTIAVSRPGESLFSKVFIIRPAVFPEGPGESHARASLSYPCATEHDGKLYVGYSNTGGRGGNHNSAEMAVVPIGALKVD